MDWFCVAVPVGIALIAIITIEFISDRTTSDYQPGPRGFSPCGQLTVCGRLLKNGEWKTLRVLENTKDTTFSGNWRWHNSFRYKNENAWIEDALGITETYCKNNSEYQDLEINYYGQSIHDGTIWRN